MHTCKLFQLVGAALLAGLAVLWIGVDVVTADPIVIYVDIDAPGAATGLSWTDAYTNVQDALAVTNANGSTNYEIWVATGVYTPGNLRTASFRIQWNNVKLYGGFPAGGGEWSERNWETYPTILSGDIDANDWNTDTNYIAETWDDIQGYNAYHVVWLSGMGNESITETTIIDGFVITAGQDENSYGGGLYCDGEDIDYRCSPTLNNLIFSGNQAKWCGGGMFSYGNSGDSSPVLTNITFSGNGAIYNGGGMCNDGGSGGNSSPVLTNVIFNGNHASQHGGGMYNYSGDGSSNPLLVNVIFSNNQAGDNGGGIYNDGWSTDSSLMLVNVIINGNLAGKDGGGIYNMRWDSGTSSPALTNVTISGNLAGRDGGGIYNMCSGSGTNSPALTNVILWGNTAIISGNQLYNQDATPALSYTLIQSGTNDIYNNDNSTVVYGDGILNDPPKFIAPITATAAPTTTGNYRLQRGSPAIDGGYNAAIPTNIITDLVGNPRFIGDIVDMGAYEAQSALAISKHVTPTLDVGYHNIATYTVVLSNAGVGNGTVILTDKLPTEVNFSAWIISPTDTLYNERAITWTGTLSAGHTLTWTFQTTNNGGPDECVTNTAEFSSTAQASIAKASFTVASNQAPVANAGADQNATAGDYVQLDGSASSDPDNHTLTYHWMQTDGNPQLTLDDSMAVRPTFVANTVGIFAFTLAVTDTFGLTAPTSDTVVVTVTNQAPVANAGSVQRAILFDSVQLDGSGSSDPDTHRLTYHWTQIGDSPALTLDDAQAISPTLTANVLGIFTFTLTVTDTYDLSSSDTVVVTVADGDTDNDGIANSSEGNIDTDGDGIPDYQDADSDGDGINDINEGDVDTDSDGIPDYQDTDSDNDGINDSEEGTNDHDNDGTPDYVDANANPTISDISDQSTLVGTSLSLTFTISDTDDLPDTLWLYAESSNLALVNGHLNDTLMLGAGITITGSEAERTLNINPSPDITGTTIITVTVNDGTDTAWDTFVLTVTAASHANTPPTLSPILNQTTEINKPLTVTFTISDVETAPGNLALDKASDNPALVPTANIIFSGSGMERMATITPTMDMTGTATLTFTVSDGEDSDTQKFPITVKERSTNKVYLPLILRNSEG